MYFYHGNKHYYLSQIFLGDQDLKELVYGYGLTSDFEIFAYKLSYQLCLNNFLSSFISTNSLSAEEFYKQEYKKWEEDSNYTPMLYSCFSSALYDSYGISFEWHSPANKELFIGMMKSFLYGSLKHFFFENRSKYLPQYDWYLINSNEKRKAIVDMLFMEFDKLTNMADALKYYQDADYIPTKFLVYLQEITGLTINTYNGKITEEQIRNLTKHLVEIWREKGALFSFELFFMSMGIHCNVRELWFDRRFYYNPTKFNPFTKASSVYSFGYYLTPDKPHTVSYTHSPESIQFIEYSAPISSQVWGYVMKNSSQEPAARQQLISEMLDYSATTEQYGAEDRFRFFKTNYLLFNFINIKTGNEIVEKNELAIYKEFVGKILPVFINAYYGGEYDTQVGGDDWDIFKWLEPGAVSDGSTVYDYDSGSDRPATLFTMFDSKSVNRKTKNKKEYSYNGGKGIWTEDFTGYVSGSFTSGTHIIIKDQRLDEYFADNNDTSHNAYAITGNGTYEVIGGTVFESSEFPAFYDENGNDYLYKDGQLYKHIDVSYEYIEVDENDLRQNDISTYYEYDSSTQTYSKTSDSVLNSSKTYYFKNMIDSHYDTSDPSQLKIVTTKDNASEEFVQVSAYPDPAPYIYYTRTGTGSESDPYIYTSTGLNTIQSEEVTDPDEEHLRTYFEKIKTSGEGALEETFIYKHTEDSMVYQEKTYYTIDEAYFRKDRASDKTYYYFKDNVRIYPYLFADGQEAVTEMVVTPDAEFFSSMLEQEQEFQYDTFDQQYTEKAMNLFEDSSWTIDIPSLDRLYDNGSWVGDLQYEYEQYTNPIEYVETTLNDNTLTITII